MKIIKTFLLLLLFQSVLFGQSGWFQQNSGTNKRINSCYFLNDATGYIVGNNGLIIKTTNGGNNWYSIYNGYIYHAVTVSFLNISTGWVYIKNEREEDSTFLLKTVNEGLTWNKYFVDTNFVPWNLAEIQFINENTGYLAGWVNLKKTTNGGVNWYVVLNQGLSGVFFINNFTGWAGGFGPEVFKTPNGGMNWMQQEAGIQNQNGVDFYFLDSQTGFCIPKAFGYNGPLYSTTNGGNNWRRHIELLYNFWSIRFVNRNTGYMLAWDYNTFTSKIAKTTNSGINWVFHNINTSRNLSKLFFSSVNTGWAVGDSGYIYKTTNGGVTIGINPISTEIPNAYSLSQNYPNPFNPNTKIKFDIPQAGGSGRDRSVRLVVYDLLGREVAILVNEELKPGVYEVDFDGSNLPSGVYYYKLISGGFTQTKKMVLLK